ncbi:MAG: hypothetical protein ACE5FU_08910, partial [Nitrospinota bacterium]
LEDRSYDWGVKFDSGYRFSETRADIPRQTGYVGLTWDILKSGLLQEKSRDRQDKFQIGLARLREPAGRLQQQLPCREIALLQMFGTLKTALFELREELLVIEYRALREAYFSGRILLDELLKIEGKVKETQEALLLQRTLNSFELKSRSFFLPEEEIPLLQIRLEPLLQVVKEKAGNPEAIELRENILREKTNPLLKNSLKLYVRSGLDREEGETDYGTFVFGVRFTAPLGRWKRKENSLELEKNRFENTRRVQKKVLETVRLFNAYEEKLKNTVTTRYEELYSKERLRRVWLLNRKMRDGGSVVDVTRALSELTDIRIKALTRQEGLYLRLLHLFTRSGVGFKNEFVEGRQSTFSVSRGRAGKRSVYIWSDSFNTYSNEFLLQVFEAKSVSRAIVSFSTKSDIKKLEPFLYLARDSGVEVELMAGANEWIYPDRGPKVTSFTGRALSFADTVHMDVEPHTLDGYRKNEQEYKQLYLKMLQRVLEARGEGKSISVSIPLKWKGPFFEKIVKLVDRVYLMAYGITGYGEMERKISPFLQAGSGEKLVIALRPGDFSDE